jgi:branched-chain amino acid transport system ATP-binding protein
MGKTTTLRTIIGFTPPQRGIIRFKDKTINGMKPFMIAQMGIGLVPQGREIFPSLSVYENLVMAARGGDQEGDWNLERVYNLFPILEKRAKFKGTLLSGGEQQMLTIARALMTNPSLLLMDEPSEGLAPLIVQEIEATISHLKKSRMSILLVEQNLYMALDLADYVYILSKGVIEYGSTPDELEANEEVKKTCLGVSGH